MSRDSDKPAVGKGKPLSLFSLTVKQVLEKMLEVKPPARGPRPKSEKDNKDNPS